MLEIYEKIVLMLKDIFGIIYVLINLGINLNDKFLLNALLLIKIVKHSIQKETFKPCRSEYSWEDCIMSGLAVFGFMFWNTGKPKKMGVNSTFEKVRNRIDIGVWENWHHLYRFIGDPTSRPPPLASGWLIA